MNKLILSLAMSLVMLFPLSASAEKTGWKNPLYDFTTIRTIKLTAIDVEQNYDESFSNDDYATEKIVGYLQKALGEKNIKLDVQIESNLTTLKKETDNLHAAMNEISTKQNAPKEYLDNGVVELHITSKRLGYRTRIIPAHQEARTRIVEFKERDNRGYEVTKERPVTDYVFVPETTEFDGMADLTFTVYDPVDNRVMFNINDNRERRGDSDISGMLQRICNLFAKQISRNK